MDEYIKLEDATAIIEEKQKELCPVGRYGRGYVYGTEREKYDAWEEILDALENLPAADVAPVVHGRKIEDGDIGCFWLCSLCGECLPYGANYCPHCGAKMDGGDDHG